VEAQARPVDEVHFEEIDVALLYLDDASQRIERAIKKLKDTGAEEHLVDALEKAHDELLDTRRRLMQGTLFAVPKAQLSF
jgi:hypothetical protein